MSLRARTEHRGPVDTAWFKAFYASRPAGERWQLVDGYPHMMAPLNRVHQTIARNLIVALVPALRASRPDLDVVHEVGVEIPGMTTFIAEPDVVILPQPADYSTYHAHFVFVAEIRSPSNEPEDLDAKVRAYGRAPENLATLVLAQDRIAADLYRRAEGWMRRELTGHDAVITLPEFGLALPLGQLYTGTPLAM